MSTSFTHMPAFVTDGLLLPQQQLTEQEFVAWALANNAKAEWVEGEVVLMSPSNWEHTSLRRWLDGLMTDYAEERQLGIVGDDTLVRLPQRRQLRIPDIFFVVHARSAIIQPTMLIEPPDLVVEVVSPDSASRDWREKYHEYEACGVREYWVIDPVAGSYDVYTLDATGHYQPVAAPDGVIRSVVLEGFWVRSEWFSERQRPSKNAALAEILSNRA